MYTGKLERNFFFFFFFFFFSVVVFFFSSSFAHTQADATTEEEPFLRDSIEGAEREQRKMVINLFSNHISSICSTNFILQDFGEAVQEEAFVFGLTFEEAWNGSGGGGGDGGGGAEAEAGEADEGGEGGEEAAEGKQKKQQRREVDKNHVKKIRVLMMREKMLSALLTKTEADIIFQVRDKISAGVLLVPFPKRFHCVCPEHVLASCDFSHFHH
jgi:hypothetical protein